ncbi:MAG: hypothetical protein ACYC64_15315 [Armatimonadota bacterium]
MKRIAYTILITMLLPGLTVVSVSVAEGDGLAVLTTVGEVNTSKTNPTTDETGLPASEIICGHGSMAGYNLGHGNVIPGSEWVYVGIKRARKNVDYTIDYASGSLYLMEPVRNDESVRVDYRYSEKAAAKRSGPSLAFSPSALGGNLQMNLTYATRLADPSQGPGAQDILTYGLNSLTKFGASSSLSSMMYMSTPQKSNRMSLTGSSTPPPRSEKKAKNDHLMLQNADLGVGKVRVKLGFQDVGEDFQGFQSMRDSNAAPNDALKQLEKEKGIQRMNMAAEIPTNADSGFNFSFGQVSDKNADITSQMFGYKTGGLAFSYSSRDVGSDFSRFNDLKEADHAQLAAEAGIRRTQYAMQLDDGAASSLSSGLSTTHLAGESGDLTQNSADLGFGRVKVHADIREVDPTFNKMSALNDEERTRMALVARRQFDANAQASSVTSDDKSKINQETGLNRANYSLAVDGGAVSTWLSLSSVDSQKGGLSRSAINVQSKQFSVYFDRHSIDNTFDRLGSLQAVELATFGNEYGMARTSFGGKFRMGFGELALNRASVADHQGAGVLRQSLDFKNPRLKLHVNFQDIDAGFSRIMDLSDADRKLMLGERGFSRSDYAINFQATKDLNIDSYIYNSTNLTEGETRGQNRFKIDYAPQRGPKVSTLHDSCSYVSEMGNLSSYSRNRIAFDNSFSFLGGMLFKGSNDVNTTQEGLDDPITTQITETHLESNQSAATSFTVDTANADYGQGRFANTQAMGVKTKISGNMALVTRFSETQRDSDQSETSGNFGMDWGITKNLKMSANVSDKSSGPQGAQRARQFSLNGLLAKRLLLFNDVKIGSGVNTTSAQGRQTGCDNALRIEAGVIGHGSFLLDNSDKLNTKTGMYYTSRILKYESDNDPKKWYHLSFMRQDLVTPTGEPAEKRNYSANARLSSRTSFTFNKHFGKDGKNGAVIPVGGSTIKLSHVLNSKLTVAADYTRDLNQLNDRRAHVMGMGIGGMLSNSAQFELYFGWSHLNEGLTNENGNVFRVKYDQKISANHYITLSAQKKSGVDKSEINPYEGNTTARLDFRTVFN